MDAPPRLTDAERWYREKYLQNEEREALFSTMSGEPVNPLYTADDVQGDPGFPGEYPYTRGVHPSMYRGRLWTMRQFAGFGTAERPTSASAPAGHGQTGLSTAFDMPTLMGHDSDHPRSEGEVGRKGVAIDTLDDMQTLFQGMPLERGQHLDDDQRPRGDHAGPLRRGRRERGIPRSSSRGRSRTTSSRSTSPGRTYIFPPEPPADDHGHPGLLPRRDAALASDHVSGYHIREAGSTAVQELAFTLAGRDHLPRGAIAAGLDVDEFAPRVSFFFNAHIDFLEEIAKFRAARRMWAGIVRDRFGARERSLPCCASTRRRRARP